MGRVTRGLPTFFLFSSTRGSTPVPLRRCKLTNLLAEPSPATVFRAAGRARRARSAAGSACPSRGGHASRTTRRTHPFRADSHFLYLVGRSIPDAALLFSDAEPTLFAPPPDGRCLWHGPSPRSRRAGADLGIKVRPLRSSRAAARHQGRSRDRLAERRRDRGIALSALGNRQGAARARSFAKAAPMLASPTRSSPFGSSTMTRPLRSCDKRRSDGDRARAGMRTTRPGLREAEVARPW